MSETECTTLVRLVPGVDSPETIVTALENYGGCLKRFCEWFPTRGDNDEQTIVSWCENWLGSLDDKKLIKRWNAAIKQNMRTRLTFLKLRALEQLESLHTPFEGVPKPVFKVTDELAFAKLVLGDLLAGEAAAAKRPATKDNDEGEDDDADLAEVMST